MSNIYHDLLLIAAKSPEPTSVDTLGNFTPEDFSSHVSSLLNLEGEIHEMERELKKALDALESRKKEYNAGIKVIKEAASLMAEEGKYVSKVRDGMVSFTLSFKTNAPGVDQMQDAYVAKLREKYEEKLASELEDLYKSTRRSIESVTPTVTSLKVVRRSTDKEAASVAQVAATVFDWLGGNVSRMTKAILRTPGTIQKWLLGLRHDADRVKESANGALSTLREMEKMMEAFNKKASSHDMVPARKLRIDRDALGDDVSDDHMENYAEELIEALGEEGYKDLDWDLRGDVLHLTGNGWKKVPADVFETVDTEVFEKGKWGKTASNTFGYDLFDA